jgi:ribonucleoside-diphosphate reductase alpha chain
MKNVARTNTETILQREPLRLTENALVILNNRYLKHDEEGQPVETPAEMFDRVACCIAAVEKKYGADDHVVKEWEIHFYNLMASLRFLPNSPTLMNAGRSMGMLSACFVLPIPDSIDGIFDAVKNTALIQKAGGGTGFSFDQLRPTGDYIASSGGHTSGPVSFWKVLSETTNAIQQGAFRRGANMGMMSLAHPDILKFLHAKQQLDAFTNYNISVKITNDWMDQFLSDPDSLHLVRNPRTGKQYVLPRTLDIWQYQITDLCKAPVEENGKIIPPENPAQFWTKRQLWDLIVENAHRTGEPGLTFIDRINQDNTTPHLGRMEAANPCGEQPLLPFEACNLGSINLTAFVRSTLTEEGSQIADAADLEPLARFDFAALRHTIHLSVRFLDNVIDANDYQIDSIDSVSRKNRKIGLGVMGFADTLYKLAVPYDSEPGCSVGREIMRFLNHEAHLASEQLARDRGNFPAWEGSIWQTQHNRPQRNAAVTTIAPTGTLSILADCSAGIEPLYSLVFTRNVLGGKQLQEVNPVFRQIAQARGFYSDDLIRRIAETGSLAILDDIPDDVKRVFVCAHDVAPEWHVRMQAAFQQHCDSAISKTINFPAHATPDQIDRIFRLAYQLNCKGITVYRDSSRNPQPMTRTSG